MMAHAVLVVLVSLLLLLLPTASTAAEAQQRSSTSGRSRRTPLGEVFFIPSKGGKGVAGRRAVGADGGGGYARRDPDGGGFCFLSFGCWGGWVKRTQKKVADAMGHTGEQHNAQFVIAAGDNFYKKGVKGLHDLRFAETFENVYTAPSLERVPWFVALGNHDYRGNFQSQVKYTFDIADKNARHSKMNRLGRWYLPYTYYAKVISEEMLLIVLDCPLMERCHNNGYDSPRCWDQGRQTRSWLPGLFNQTSSSYLWKVAVCHYPMFANGPHVNHKWLIDFLQPLFDVHCVSLYIHADNHYMQLSVVDKVFYVNSGGGAGMGMQHTSRDKGYKRSPHSRFENITDGYVVHCLYKNRERIPAQQPGGGGSGDSIPNNVEDVVESIAFNQDGVELFRFTAHGSDYSRCLHHHDDGVHQMSGGNFDIGHVFLGNEDVVPPLSASASSAGGKSTFGGGGDGGRQPEVLSVPTKVDGGISQHHQLKVEHHQENHNTFKENGGSSSSSPLFSEENIILGVTAFVIFLLLVVRRRRQHFFNRRTAGNGATANAKMP